jgi:hypothetical protein
MKFVLLACLIPLFLSLSNYQGLPTKQETVCRGKLVPVELIEPLFGMKLSGPRVPFLNVGISHRTRLVIRDRDEFDEFWRKLFRFVSDKPALPEIDFSREMIVVAAMGQQPTSGYHILIDSACEVDNQLEVSVRSTNFSKCGQFPVVTAPADMVRLPKTDLPVTFRETETTADCKKFWRP